MKIRLNFVSNSSTSSCIVVGIPFESTRKLMKKFGIPNEDEEELYEIFKKKGLTILHEQYDNECTGVGVELMNAEPYEDISLELLEKEIEKAVEIMSQYGYSRSDLKLINQVNS